MKEQQKLAAEFEANRSHLRAIAYRMLSSSHDADDAVQETWLRLSRTDTDSIGNLTGWLTTVLGRVCLDMLRSRSSRREDALSEPMFDPSGGPRGGTGAETDPEHEAELVDAVGLALLVVLDTLAPSERLAFVLHDVFAVPFEQIAGILGTSSGAARQLASRARRRVRGAPPESTPDPSRHRQLVDAFLAASRSGNFTALLELLDPGVVLRADSAAVSTGAEREVLGADAVAKTFSGRAQAAQSASVDGNAGAVWAPGGKPRVVFCFTVNAGQITAITMLANRDHIRRLNLVILDA
ncbi:sigma-70 family RNA polymerase sigma factor [Paenarthrobacter sp. Z7-10]|uniref:sigma-70 family RNA polymerase sigma factor n=1 Tax=Paenarthrobacter sp. Z7-10 TaxID=2787635 RepID=UPI0022A8E56A|nr:sigma-70 family RNA polymerase sigma factor [Paenarthrobacter sp. Z7-10]MCZ2402218.1 sigma-70 family RNA polymerase sigma factor [Paenarthrobacter sp. Z7-10]